FTAGRFRLSCALSVDRQAPRRLAQIDANKCKQTKAKLLSFAFAYFSESVLFNGLRPIQTRKNPPIRPRRPVMGVDAANGKRIALLLVFRK
ncbi:MAG TPA: hypothetical protein VGF57_03890, partial [Roseiarcus sp.]